MYLYIAFLGAVVALLVLSTRKYDLLSKVCTIYLELRYPIRDIETGAPLPTLPFQFPNGQGNIEKFIHGRANSEKWAAEYGSLYRIWSGFSGEIVVARPADIETVFKDSHVHIKSLANDSGYLMHQLLGSCLGLVSGAEWKAIRRATEAPFTKSQTPTYVDLVVGHAKDHASSLLSSPSKPSTDVPDRGTIKPYADLRVYTFISLAEIMYGGLTPTLKDALVAIIPGRDSVFADMMRGGLSRFYWSRFLPLPEFRKLRAFKKAWEDWNDDAHAEALRRYGSMETSQPAPIVPMYAKVADGTMSKEALMQTLDEMLFANLDIAIGGLAWATIFIAALPHVQKRLLSDIRNDCTLEFRERFLLSQSNYLHHILLEAGRLRPVAAFSVSQSCPTPRKLGNFILPAGTKFLVDANSLNVRDPLWAPDNTAFRPERWAEGGVQRAKDIRYCYWRFGFGPRVCLGKYIVDLMMKALIVELVTGWELKLQDEEGKEWPWTEETWNIDPQMRVGCVKRTEKN